jgi:hypothetical protein
MPETPPLTLPETPKSKDIESNSQESFCNSDLPSEASCSHATVALRGKIEKIACGTLIAEKTPSTGSSQWCKELQRTFSFCGTAIVIS